ncbi:hypothetical protein HNR68_002941 [Saccharopolyspora hordei]|uniref:Uncharacterized protein n=1 Tax=Saccharopolyspora hordei TaxID=1838 RepID=A0A853ARU2_9PSEU|nr:hypothetical protein [Saccharopolyspora hordei]
MRCAPMVSLIFVADESREFRSSAMRILVGVLSVVLSLVFLGIGG